MTSDKPLVIELGGIRTLKLWTWEFPLLKNMKINVILSKRQKYHQWPLGLLVLIPLCKVFMVISARILDQNLKPIQGEGIYVC